MPHSHSWTVTDKKAVLQYASVLFIFFFFFCSINLFLLVIYNFQGFFLQQLIWQWFRKEKKSLEREEYFWLSKSFNFNVCVRYLDLWPRLSGVIKVKIPKYIFVNHFLMMKFYQQLINVILHGLFLSEIKFDYRQILCEF